jgi:hypothetical protein
MEVIFAFVATLVLIALAVWQRRSREESRGRDFAMIAIMALMMTIYYCYWRPIMGHARRPPAKKGLLHGPVAVFVLLSFYAATRDTFHCALGGDRVAATKKPATGSSWGARTLAHPPIWMRL